MRTETFGCLGMSLLATLLILAFVNFSIQTHVFKTHVFPGLRVIMNLLRLVRGQLMALSQELQVYSIDLQIICLF